MDAESISAITNLTPAAVKGVFAKCNNNQSEINRALESYLDSQSGPFKEAEASGPGWAESGAKKRGAKKVRPAACGRRARAPRRA